MSITPEEVSKTAKLARLSVEGEEAIEVAERISAILELVEQMQATDTQNVEPMANPHDAVQILRKDETGTLPDLIAQRDEFLDIAPETQDGLFLVPKVIE